MALHVLHLLVLLFWIVVFRGQSKSQEDQEPVCMSRFDYEHKMLHSIVKLEIGQEKQQESIEKLKQRLENENRVLKGEVIQLRDTVESQSLTIKTLVVNNKNLEKNLTAYSSSDGMEIEGYTFKDYLAQATCTALSTHAVYAVRRTCSSSYPGCTSVCSSQGKKCVNSLHVYARKDISTNDVGKLGLHMHRYNGCGGGCGPNFCCCQG